MLMLTLTAAIRKLHPSHCLSTPCMDPTPPQLAFLYTAFGLLVIGASGIRPCNLAFGADQFNPNTESGQAGIASFFNWYYFTLTFAMMVSLTLIVYVQSNVNWAIGLAIPTLLMFFSCAFFFLGTKIYVKVMPEGSPLTSILQVLVATIRKRKLTFLNKAAIFCPGDNINPDGSSGNRWTLCSMQQIEEVKCVIKTIPILIAATFYAVSLNQTQTFTVYQALQSDRRFRSNTFKIPAASYTSFQMLTLTIWIPIYDRIMVPFLRKLTKKRDGITILQRMGTGLGINILAMLMAGIVEAKRRNMANSKSVVGFEPRRGSVSSMSANWLVLQLVFSGLSEGFTIIGVTEFFYKEFPENMRSFAGSITACGIAMSLYLSSFLILMVHRLTREDNGRNWLADDLNEAKLDHYYYFCAGLGAMNFIYFLMCAKWYKYKGTGNEPVEMPSREMKPGKHDV
ncbi:Major facilitator superfamily domain, general substrate transporter [Cynara cardunculus var. scolymus]|uniref:Major facilitator superfamily domain, general substrate transporter n=1 Tax=Cynara cardunculus var. scolymus TaxID=59895 RepID=A0A118JZ16_CYNCS|nr:Major facilitator superfamily domain, general substrate transporter [Cynara cardunculus var. scolymus]